MAFVKLYDRILNSSLNDEGLAVRWLFITMLAMSSPHGKVTATRRALARAANIPQADADAALEVLLAPDPSSTTEAEGGRRVLQEGQNQWLLVNYEKYRQMRDEDREREQARLRQRRHRERKKAEAEADVTECHGQSRKSHEKKKKKKKKRESEQGDSFSKGKPSATDRVAIRAWCYVHGFEGWWALYPKKASKADAEKAFCFDLTDTDRQNLVANTRRYLDGRKRAADAGQFVHELPYPATFIRNERWTDRFLVDGQKQSSAASAYEHLRDDTEAGRHERWAEFADRVHKRPGVDPINLPDDHAQAWLVWCDFLGGAFDDSR
jgi:hypothetical protein